MTNRRGTYFAFQGLLMAVLLLLFLQDRQSVEHWTNILFLLLAFMAGSLGFIRLASEETLSWWWVQAALFVSDAALASLILHWTNANSNLYLLYLLIIYGTALTRRWTHSLVIAIVTSILYIAAAWRPQTGLPHDAAFWLRVNFLWIMSALLAILSRDTQQSQESQDQKYRDRLIEVERLATLGQVAGEVAHSIKGPLTTIMVNAEVLAHRLAKSKDAIRELTQIKDEAARCREILKNLLDLGRIEEMDFARLDIRAPIRSAVQSVEGQAKAASLKLALSGLEKPLMAEGDQSLLHQAVAAVLQNAVEASRPGGTITITARAARGDAWWRAPKGAEVFQIVIEDQGEGVEPKNLERIFTPFFTTKGSGGSGLGLSAALRILQKHNGSIEAYSAGRGRGARFTLRLPRARRSARA